MQAKAIVQRLRRQRTESNRIGTAVPPGRAGRRSKRAQQMFPQDLDGIIAGSPGLGLVPGRTAQ